MDPIFIEIARVLSKKSTCCLIKNAAVIVKDGNILGYGVTDLGECERYWREIHKKEWEEFKKTDDRDRDRDSRSTASTRSLSVTRSTASTKAKEVNGRPPTGKSKKDGDGGRDGGRDSSRDRSDRKSTELSASSLAKIAAIQDSKKVKKSYLLHAKGPKSSWKKYIKSEKFISAHETWSYDHETHAEFNAVFNRSPGADIKDATMYCLYSPCVDCARIIRKSGICKIYFDVLVDRRAIDYLAQYEIQCINYASVLEQPVTSFDISSSSDQSADDSD
jgi:deoxycytidylate deaminase